ncbi:MAG: transposase [Planctomycetota bacterium]
MAMMATMRFALTVRLLDRIGSGFKSECRPFPDAESPALRRGTRRNFQILPVLDFIAEFTQHRPIKGSHLIRYSGWYSNKARGLRAKWLYKRP